MLAAYLQIMEQNKAAASVPTYQTTSTYNPSAPPQGHYYYRH